MGGKEREPGSEINCANFSHLLRTAVIAAVMKWSKFIEIILCSLPVKLIPQLP